MRDGGVSAESLVVLELLLGVAVACRSSSDAASGGGEGEDGSDGFERFGGGVASSEGDWQFLVAHRREGGWHGFPVQDLYGSGRVRVTQAANSCPSNEERAPGQRAKKSFELYFGKI